MTGYSRGDVILVGFIFSDEGGEKKRPAIIVSSNNYHFSRDESIIVAITSNTERLLLGDYLIHDWQEAGLLFPSVVTGILRTIKQKVILKKLGTMPGPDMRNIEDKLRTILDL